MLNMNKLKLKNYFLLIPISILETSKIVKDQPIMQVQNYNKIYFKKQKQINYKTFSELELGNIRINFFIWELKQTVFKICTSSHLHFPI